MSGLPPKLQDLLETLEMLPDRADRIQMLIDLAERFEGVPERVAARPYPEEHRVRGCESEAFVWAEPQGDGTVKLWYAVENPQGVSAQSLAVILDRTLSGASPEEIARVPSDVIYRIFGRELSMGKSMGLMGMIGQTQVAARKALAAR